MIRSFLTWKLFMIRCLTFKFFLNRGPWDFTEISFCAGPVLWTLRLKNYFLVYNRGIHLYFPIFGSYIRDLSLEIYFTISWRLWDCTKNSPMWAVCWETLRFDENTLWQNEIAKRKIENRKFFGDVNAFKKLPEKETFYVYIPCTGELWVCKYFPCMWTLNWGLWVWKSTMCGPV